MSFPYRQTHRASYGVPGSSSHHPQDHLLAHLYPPLFVQIFPSYGSPPVNHGDRRILVQVHAKLSKDRPISWDLWLPLSFALDAPEERTRSIYAGLSPSLLVEPATTPSTNQLTLHIPDLQGWWSVPVTPHETPHVTTGDVLQSLYDTLHISITAEEWREVEDAEMDGEITASFIDRVRACATPGAQFQSIFRDGKKRIDLLTKNHFFYGLEVVNPRNVDDIELRLQVP
ncbi:uncharacterized protein FIBRA_08082 [Fibroporia radiculosa]|uniref:DUF6699 domain-containing protein n=1 Tax=Fibroporia radiculosa TaxID=599839 RepID=J4IC60_9APHY|nr:uncharacterized protein FIBRA_08082 [Fibroporia radiculosa]CCM05846.1 predicted protein [Fibroporia radiculosa]